MGKITCFRWWISWSWSVRARRIAGRIGNPSYLSFYMLQRTHPPSLLRVCRIWASDHAEHSNTSCCCLHCYMHVNPPAPPSVGTGMDLLFCPDPNKMHNTANTASCAMIARTLISSLLANICMEAIEEYGAFTSCSRIPTAVCACRERPDTHKSCRLRLVAPTHRTTGGSPTVWSRG